MSTTARMGRRDSLEGQPDVTPISEHAHARVGFDGGDGRNGGGHDDGRGSGAHDDRVRAPLPKGAGHRAMTLRRGDGVMAGVALLNFNGWREGRWRQFDGRCFDTTGGGEGSSGAPCRSSKPRINPTATTGAMNGSTVDHARRWGLSSTVSPSRPSAARTNRARHLEHRGR